MTKHDLTLPDWEPLERALPDTWLDGWMFMFFDSPPDDGELLRSYKHSITRRYLHLRIEHGQVAAYRHLGSGRYTSAKLVEEVEEAYASIERLGFTREMEADRRRLSAARRSVTGAAPARLAQRG